MLTNTLKQMERDNKSENKTIQKQVILFACTRKGNFLSTSTLKEPQKIKEAVKKLYLDLNRNEPKISTVEED